MTATITLRNLHDGRLHSFEAVGDDSSSTVGEKRAGFDASMVGTRHNWKT